MWLIRIAILLCIYHVNGFIFNGFGTNFEYLAKTMNETISTFDSSAIQINWIEQPLNHFDSNDNRRFVMKYFERNDLIKPNPPVYIFLGGEGPLTSAFLQTGVIFDLAKETGGLLLAAEHRYYGNSKPFKAFTPENLVYLSSRQALADFANLVKRIKSSPGYKSSKVVVIGGSYAGNLAAWMKVIYPDLVDAAIASSAPVLAKKDFYEYLEVVSADFKKYGTPGCWDQIAQKFLEYERLLKTDEGIQTLKKQEMICDECDMHKPENQQLFLERKIKVFAYIAENGGPDEIQAYCKSNFTSSLKKYESRDLFWNLRQVPDVCALFDFDKMISFTKTYNSGLPWIYQTCTEFGYFRTSSSDSQPFTKNLPAEYYYKICTKLFGTNFDENRVDKGVEASNKLYGGLTPNVSHVLFVNGDMDPWSTLSVLKDLSHDAPAKIISQTSHCKDLLSDMDSDSKELKEARKYIRSLIKQWIGQEDY